MFFLIPGVNVQTCWHCIFASWCHVIVFNWLFISDSYYYSPLLCFYCITVSLYYFIILRFYCITVYSVYMGHGAWIKINQWMNKQKTCSPLSTSWIIAWSSVPDGATTCASSFPWTPLKSTVNAAGLLIYITHYRCINNKVLTIINVIIIIIRIRIRSTRRRRSRSRKRRRGTRRRTWWPLDGWHDTQPSLQLMLIFHDF